MRLLTGLLEGHFERHLRQMRRLYSLRRQTLIGALDKAFRQSGNYYRGECRYSSDGKNRNEL